MSGDLDIAFGAWPSLLLANQQGIELRAIANGVAADEGFTQFLAMPDSGLEGNGAGLEGKTIAVNTLNNLGELAVRSAIPLFIPAIPFAAFAGISVPGVEENVLSLQQLAQNASYRTNGEAPRPAAGSQAGN